jgi:4-hydroxybenzoate polyprenyltransferase
MRKTSAKSSTYSDLRKEIDSWISDYPKLSALKHPIRAIVVVLAVITFVGILAAEDSHSALGGILCALLFLWVACAHITKNKF